MAFSQVLRSQMRRGCYFSTIADANIGSIRTEFAMQASLYAPHERCQAFVMSEIEQTVSDWGSTALDVASGTGVFARSLSPLCETVIAFDATPEMINRSRMTAEDQGITNILFELGDASNLPHADGRFDLVVSRLAVHHFSNPGRIVSEMARVCKPGGRVILADIIADDDPELREETDRLEILRDPSHTSCLTLAGLYTLLQQANLSVLPHSGNIYEHPLSVNFWMDNTQTKEEARIEIVSRLMEELNGGRRTGMQPFINDQGKLTFLHRYAVAQGIVPVKQ